MNYKNTQRVGNAFWTILLLLAIISIVMTFLNAPEFSVLFFVVISVVVIVYSAKHADDSTQRRHEH